MTCEIRNENDFLTGASVVVTIPEEELDTKALYTIQADRPEFLIPFFHRSVDGQVEFVYQIGPQSKLQYLSGVRSPKEYAKLWTGVLTPLLDCGDWFMKPYSFVLSADYLYYDKQTETVCYIYIPSIRDQWDQNAIKELAAELSKHISVTDMDFENKVLRAILKDFCPKNFLRLLEPYITLSAAPAALWPTPVQAPAHPQAPEPPQNIKTPDQELSFFESKGDAQGVSGDILINIPAGGKTGGKTGGKSSGKEGGKITGKEGGKSTDKIGGRSARKTGGKQAGDSEGRQKRGFSDKQHLWGAKEGKKTDHTTNLFNGKPEEQQHKQIPGAEDAQYESPYSIDYTVPSAVPPAVPPSAHPAAHPVIPAAVLSSTPSAALSSTPSAAYPVVPVAVPSSVQIQDQSDLTQLVSAAANRPGLRLVGSALLPPMVDINVQAGDIFTIGRYDAVVGRRQSDFEFDKKTKAVSRRHAAIERSADGYRIVDLSSSAGTFLDGYRLPPNTPCPLIHGCRVSFGNAGADYVWEDLN